MRFLGGAHGSRNHCNALLASGLACTFVYRELERGRTAHENAAKNCPRGGLRCNLDDIARGVSVRIVTTERRWVAGSGGIEFGNKWQFRALRPASERVRFSRGGDSR